MKQTQSVNLPREGRTAAHINGDEILQGLAHLKALDVQMAGVEEIVHPCAAVVIRLDDRKQKIEVWMQDVNLRISTRSPSVDAPQTAPSTTVAVCIFTPAGNTIQTYMYKGSTVKVLPAQVECKGRTSFGSHTE